MKNIFKGSYTSVDTFIWALPIEIVQNLNKINKIIIKLRPAVSWFINFFDDFLLILTDLNFFLISATLGIAQTSLALLSLARDFYAEGV